MTAIQRTFDDLADKETRKRVAREYARKMIALLTMRKCWTTRKDFLMLMGLNDRAVRAGREASHGRIAFGQQGYKLIKDLTCDEYKEYEARLEADIRSAKLRKYQAQMRYHGKNYMEELCTG